LLVRQAPSSLRAGAQLLPSTAEGRVCGSARRIGMGRGSRRVTTRYRWPIIRAWCSAAARGEHTESSADRPSLRIQSSPTPTKRLGTTRLASKVWCRARKMSRGIPWEWRRARGAISRRIALQPVHFQIKRTREQRCRAPHVRPRTTREAGARAPSAIAVPMRLLDAAAVAELAT
jgi:hypothetical protein